MPSKDLANFKYLPNTEAISQDDGMERRGFTQGQSGMTLVSTMIAAAIGMLLMSALMASAQYSSMSARTTSQALDAQEMRYMLRLAVSNPSSCIRAFKTGIRVEVPRTAPPWNDINAWRSANISVEISNIVLGSRNISAPSQVEEKPEHESDLLWGGLQIRSMNLREYDRDNRYFANGYLHILAELSLTLQRQGKFLGAPSLETRNAVLLQIAPDGTLAGCSESDESNTTVPPIEITCRKQINNAWVTDWYGDAGGIKHAPDANFSANKRIVGLSDALWTLNYFQFSAAECGGNLPDQTYRGIPIVLNACQFAGQFAVVNAGEAVPMRQEMYLRTLQRMTEAEQDAMEAALVGPGLHFAYNGDYENCRNFFGTANNQLHAEFTVKFVKKF
jgi:hypothetical protein